MNFKRHRPKNARAGCLMCKPWKADGARGTGASVHGFRTSRRPVSDARRLQVGREERLGREFDDEWAAEWVFEEDCGCDECVGRADLDDEELALFNVAQLVASLHRPFAGLFPTSPASP